MKKALSMLCLPREKSLKENLEFTKSAGYEGIELRFSTEGELNLNATASELETIAEMCNEVGLVPCSACGTGGGAIASPQKEQRKIGKEGITKLLHCAAALNIDAILVVPGRVSEDIPYDVAYNWALESCRELAPIAEELKVNVAIENVWNKLFLSPLEMRDFLDKVNSPYVGQFFDVGNVVIFGYPEQWINILGERIKKVHVKDFKRQGYEWKHLMEGDVNWKLVMKALRESAKYDDFLISEVGGGPDVHVKTAETIEKIIAL